MIATLTGTWKRLEDSVDESAPPSKTQRKNDVTALQNLGVALAQLRPEQLRGLNLSEPLENALLELRRLPTHGAQRRQRQYIGRLMRAVDPAPLQAYLDQLAGRSLAATVALHRVEQWRARLLADVTQVDLLVAQHPQTDRHQLRQLVLGAQREQALAKPPRQFRALFQVLNQLLAQGGPSNLAQEPLKASRDDSTSHPNEDLPPS